MDIEEFTRKNIKKNTKKEKIIKYLTKIIQQYKDITEEKAKIIAITAHDEILTTEKIKQTNVNELLSYPETKITMGKFGVGSRGEGDFYVHNKIADIIKNTPINSIINPTAQDDGGVVKVNETDYITTAIDGIHSRLSEYPFIAGFHTARATLRDVCVMGAKPVALISDIHQADDGDIGKLLDYTAGICAISELTKVPLVSGSTLRIGGDMVLGDRLTGAVGAVGTSKELPTSRNQAQKEDIILMTEGAGGGTITTTAIFNNYPNVIEETLNIQFIKAAQILLDYPKQESIHAMTDITNGGINGDANEINKTTKLGIHLYKKNIIQLINTKVYNMLKELEIDPLGVSIDSLMIIVSPAEANNIKKVLNKNNIKTDIIGKINDTGKTTIEDESGEIKIIKPKFREAAYTPIKKVVDSIKINDLEKNKIIIDNATKEAITKKDKIVEKIKNNQK